MSESLHGLPPIVGARPTVLVLGNMPSVLSLAHGEYYGNPRNAFWRICADIHGFDPEAAYPLRVAALTGHGVAVWDVLRSCRRIGSLDSAVQRDSMVANDIGAFVADHPTIGLLVFNGGAALRNYRRLIPEPPDLPVAQLPSTSPAHTMAYAEKLDRWRAAHRLR
ncbi:DNA-deoxyinosine glycosylase [Mycobacterium sp. NPDC003323]